MVSRCNQREEYFSEKSKSNSLSGWISRWKEEIKWRKFFRLQKILMFADVSRFFFFFLISLDGFRGIWIFFFNRSKYHRFERNCYFEISIRNTGRNEIGKNLKFVVLFGFSKNRQNSWIDNISRRVKYASVI